MPSSDKMLRSELRKLARPGRPIDECFKTFQRAAYPGAKPDQVAALRIAFFAGAAEIRAVMHAAPDEGDGISGEEEAIMQGRVTEIETLHERTSAAMAAKGHRQ
jgi:hypothetical protein